MRVKWSRLADLGCVAAIVLATLGALWALYYHGRRLEQEQVQAFQQLAVLQARHSGHLFGQTLAAVELSLRGLLQAEAQDPAAQGREQRLRQLLLNAPHLRSLSLLDARGVVVASSNSGNVGRQVDLRGFLPEADGSEPPLRLGAAQAGRDLADARAPDLDASAGADLGFVPAVLGGGPRGLGAVATLNTDFFLNRLLARDADAPGVVDLLRYDGAPLLSTGEALPPAWRAANQALARRWQGGAEIGTLLQPIAGRGGWITAWRGDPARPFAVVVRVEEAQALAGARAEARHLQLIVVPLIVLANGALLLGYALLRRATLRRMRRQADQLEQQARLLDALPASVTLFGPDGRALVLNQAWRDMAREAALPAGSQWALHYAALAALFRPDDGSGCGLDEGIAAVLAGQREAYEGSFQADGADGPRWFRGLVRPLLREDRRCVLLLLLDVTAQRRGAEALRLNSLVFSISDEAIVITDACNRIVSVNPAFTRITGYENAEVLGRTPALLSSGQHDGAFYAALWTQLREQGMWAGEIVNRRKSGELYTEWLTITVDRDAEGRPRHFVGVFQDITEKKRAEERLRLLGAALDAADNAVMIADALGVVEWANPAFSRLSGYALPELPGQRLQALLGQGARRGELYAQLWRTILAGDVWRGEMLNRRLDGTHYHAAHTVTPLSDGGGYPHHFIAVMEDISTRKRQEQELQRLATTDALTGLLNRRAFLQEVEQELQRFRRHGRAGTLLMLDLDHFKRVNDRYGHPVGDTVLVQVSAVLRERLRLTDRIGRLGGEEFAVLLPETEPQGALPLAQVLREAVAALRIATPMGPLGVTVSIGLAVFLPGEPDAAPLLNRADKALYQAKEQGRDRVVVAQELAAVG
jgi:diguanylate cyclase (GGDEF)-like protein/PAS domain S-box-containing protein